MMSEVSTKWYHCAVHPFCGVNELISHFILRDILFIFFFSLFAERVHGCVEPLHLRATKMRGWTLKPLFSNICRHTFGCRLACQWPIGSITYIFQWGSRSTSGHSLLCWPRVSKPSFYSQYYRIERNYSCEINLGFQQEEYSAISIKDKFCAKSHLPDAEYGYSCHASKSQFLVPDEPKADPTATIGPVHSAVIQVG